MTRRIGILGGSFDPIHNGHLAIAEDARGDLGLEQVLFVPAVRSPLKWTIVATAKQRMEMVQAACTGHGSFLVSDVELQRPPPSYTIDTLDELKQIYNDDTEFYFILGADALNDLPRWQDPERVLELCTLVVVPRPGSELDIQDISRELPQIRQRLVILNTSPLAISSTEIRQRVSTGRSIRYLVPDAVRMYITQHGLYRG